MKTVSLLFLLAALAGVISGSPVNEPHNPLERRRLCNTSAGQGRCLSPYQPCPEGRFVGYVR